MTPSELARLRGRLLEMQALRLADLSSGSEAAGTVELDQARVGRLSRMDALQSQAMSQEANRRRGLELQRIEAALDRIDAGRYGECMRCGEPIVPARLEADPATPWCIDCASAVEQG